MRVFENKHLSIDYFKELSYFKVIRIGVDKLNEDSYKKLVLDWREKIEYYKPRLQLVSYLNYYVPIPPEMQKWINHNIIQPALEVGMQKVGFIISRDLYVQGTIVKTMKGDAGQKLTIKYFDHKTDAEKWLFNPWE